MASLFFLLLFLFPRKEKEEKQSTEGKGRIGFGYKGAVYPGLSEYREAGVGAGGRGQRHLRGQRPGEDQPGGGPLSFDGAEELPADQGERLCPLWPKEGGDYRPIHQRSLKGN